MRIREAKMKAKHYPETLHLLTSSSLRVLRAWRIWFLEEGLEVGPMDGLEEAWELVYTRLGAYQTETFGRVSKVKTHAGLGLLATMTQLSPAEVGRAMDQLTSLRLIWPDGTLSDGVLDDLDSLELHPYGREED